MRIALAFARQAAGTPKAHLCAACVDVLGVSAAGVTLMSNDHSGPVCASSARSSILEDLQFSLGVGPCRDAFNTRAPVLAPDLEHEESRWLNFSGPAIEIGVHAVFASPLSVGAARLGALTLYQDEPGLLSREQTDDTLALADVLAQTMLTMQWAGDPDVLAPELSNAGDHLAEVHQASGMVAVQLGVPVAEALARIRAHAFVAARPVAEVAADIVGLRLRLDDDRSR